MIFALSAGVLGAAVGGAVDMSRLYTAREQLQLVTDAAALAGKHAEVEHIRKNGRLGSRAAGEGAAEVYFTGNRGSMDGFVNNANMVPAWDADDGALRVNATGEVEMLFGGLFGVDTVDLNVTAAAVAGLGVPTEVAMVLDTTASMFQRDGRPETRFQLLRQAAVRFANDMFDAASMQEDRLRVAVIPWTTTVNILGPAPRAWSPGGTGVAVTADAGSRQLVAAPMARDANVVEGAALRTSMFAPVQWRGCISGQRETLDTTDAVMTGMQWNVLRVDSQPQTLTQREGVNVSVPRTTCTGTCGGSPPPPPPPVSPPPPTSPPPPPLRRRRPRHPLRASSPGCRASRRARSPRSRGRAACCRRPAPAPPPIKTRSSVWRAAARSSGSIAPRTTPTARATCSSGPPPPAI